MSVADVVTTVRTDLSKTFIAIISIFVVVNKQIIFITYEIISALLMM